MCPKPDKTKLVFINRITEYINFIKFDRIVQQFFAGISVYPIIVRCHPQISIVVQGHG